MPGLSQYRQHRAEEEDAMPNIIEGPEPVEPDSILTPDIYSNMQKRLQDYMGFADPKRSMPDTLFHGVYNNVPKDQLDVPFYYMPQERLGTEDFPTNYNLGVDTSFDNPLGQQYTWRQILNVLNSLRPKEEKQAP